MSKLDQILEVCLQAIERGDTIETIVSRYPQFADELRPILEAAVSMKNKNLFEVPSDVVRRNRAKLFQQAAEMREGRVKRGSQGVWFIAFRRALVTLIVLAFVFASGTGLVRAASSTLPGDQLYPVKRTWEDILVFVTLGSQHRETLELEQENERLGELRELFEARRSASVDFSGLVTTQNSNQWSVSGINVLITSQTQLPQEIVSIGTGIRVVGHAQDGVVQADSIALISLNAIDTNQAVSSNTNAGQTATPVVANNAIPTPEPKATAVVVQPAAATSFKGIVQSMDGNVWIINGVRVNVSMADISGRLADGVVAKVEGYFDQNGVFIAKRIELPENKSGDKNSNGGDDVLPSSTATHQNYQNENDHNENDHVTETPEKQNEDHNNEHVTETPEPQH
ncbi:MAG: DUF5666 domain-containing protein [Chloroflexota bacterium]